MSKIIALIGVWGNKLLDLFSKKTKSGEKAQEIEVKKIDVFSKVLAFIFIGVFLMCALASLVPSLEITPYWFDVFERFINYILTN
ncbi:hypothetical protein [Fusobacterium mortiferum]|uniref:TMhelix containing protein n=1 Tax=Fusobacterium mortiferum TaxID=850 RepID=A0ABS2G3R7_FUSMR|nr:hypothetical protein [Fusobacterium mortiferum]MBM6876081.1 hypothetical protein [Fusobacterium mortiferum]